MRPAAATEQEGAFADASARAGPRGGAWPVCFGPLWCDYLYVATNTKPCFDL